MLDTAVRQLRYGVAVLANRRVRVEDLHRLVDDILATRAELGEVGDEQRRLMQGGALDADARRQVDARRWRLMVRKAYEETAWYRRRLDELGLRPADLTFDRMADLPPTPKPAVRALPEAFVSSRSTPVLQAWTTGTTGVPTAVWFSRYEVELSTALGAVAVLLQQGFGPEDVVQLCVSSRSVLGVATTMGAFRLVGAASLLTGIVDPEDALARLAAPVHLPGKKPQVTTLTANPSYLGALVQAARRCGYGPEDFGLERILCAGEVLTEALRRRAAEVFGVAPTDTYAMTETFPLGGILCERGHLHLGADQGLVELLDPTTFAPARPGEVATLVVTPCFPYRETTILLRLATGDLVRALPEQPTDCSMAGVPATSPLLGRVALTVSAGDRPLYQRDVLEVLESEPAVPLPARWAVEAAADGVDLHVLVDEDDAALLGRLEDAVAERGLPVRKVVLHTGPSSMPPPQFARAWLRETTVGPGEGGAGWALR